MCQLEFIIASQESARVRRGVRILLPIGQGRGLRSVHQVAAGVKRYSILLQPSAIRRKVVFRGVSLSTEFVVSGYLKREAEFVVD